MNIEQFLSVKKTHKLSNTQLNSKLNEIIDIIKSKRQIGFQKKKL